MPTQSHGFPTLSEIDTEMSIREFIGRVLVAALENQSYEIKSAFLYGGNLVDFEMRITGVHASVDITQLQETVN